ncbi:hypothetical protein L1987_55261 [Smallanthus sonchifolius]|uniref:Uncharacterized protein n=1 Tax=Smallanthus sonchifolius TaxID=185202 RepID=A0ACB9E9D9_9ASTR|nr:hypothetical protein L1987_55261 [Smallanthus sonchifolius]
MPSRRSEPPDPNTDGKFWQSEGSEDEGSNDERNMEQSCRRSRQKSRDKPSNFLDGTMETALRRYGLRSAGSNVGISNPSTTGVTTSMQKRGKDSGKESRIPSGKENIPERVNHASVLDYDPTFPLGSDSLVVGMDTNPSMHEENNNVCVGQDVTMQNSDPLHVNSETGMNDSEGSNVQQLEAGLLEGSVMLNMEYAGDSILNEFSCGDSHEDNGNMDDEDDPEVSSDQSTKQKRFVPENSSLEVPVMNLNCADMMVVEEANADATKYKTDWESMIQEQVGIIWPEVWSSSTPLDEENSAWQESIQTVKANWAEWDNSKLVHLYKPEDYPPLTHDMMQGQFLFNEQEKIVECLAKWGSNPKNTDHAAWRKIATKTGGENVVSGNRTNTRIRHKGKTSRNRQQELKGSFQNVEFIPKMLYTQTMGFNEFKMGIAQENKDRTAGKPIKLKNRAVRNIYDELAAREARLTAIVSNIIKTNDNSILITSILNMSKQRVTKFSAKVNEHGGVSIDENMIENAVESVQEDLVVDNTKGVSYANMLTGTADKGSLQEILNETQDKDQTGQNSDEGIGGKHSGVMELDPSNSVQARHNKPRSSSPSVIETANRFILLDDEGKELDEGVSINVQECNEAGIDSKMNAGWIKKQERILNTKYNELVNQSQRFEAKKAAAWDQPPSIRSEHATFMDTGELMKEVEPEKECLSDPMYNKRAIQEVHWCMRSEACMQCSTKGTKTKASGWEDSSRKEQVATKGKQDKEQVHKPKWYSYLTSQQFEKRPRRGRVVDLCYTWSVRELRCFCEKASIFMGQGWAMMK